MASVVHRSSRHGVFFLIGRWVPAVLMPIFIALERATSVLLGHVSEQRDLWVLWHCVSQPSKALLSAADLTSDE